MKIFFLHIIVAALRAVYSIGYRWRSRKTNRIVFLSRQSDTIPLDFKLLAEELKRQKPNVELLFHCERMEKSNLIQIFRATFGLFRQMRLISTAKVCILDSYCLPASVLDHSDGLKILQIWHSLGGFKMASWQIRRTLQQRTVANILRMHRGYTRLLCASPAIADVFEKAFDVPHEKLVFGLLPRVDHLLSTVKQAQTRVYNYHPELRGHRIVAYLPTFRISGEDRSSEFVDAARANGLLPIAKVHPRTRAALPNTVMLPDISSFEAMAVADVVVTDYSASSIEAAIIGKPVILWLYDETDYTQKEGLNFDLRKLLPGRCFVTADEAAHAANESVFDNTMVEFREKFVPEIDGHATEKLARMVLQL